MNDKKEPWEQEDHPDEGQDSDSGCPAEDSGPSNSDSSMENHPGSSGEGADSPEPEKPKDTEPAPPEDGASAEGGPASEPPQGPPPKESGESYTPPYGGSYGSYGPGGQGGTGNPTGAPDGQNPNSQNPGNGQPGGSPNDSGQPPYGGYGPCGYGAPGGQNPNPQNPGGGQPPYGSYGPCGYGAPGGQNPNPQNPGGGQPPYGSYGPYGYGGQGVPPGNGGYYGPYGYGYGNQGYGGGNDYHPQPGRPPMPPRQMNTGLKIFLWFLGIIAVGLVIAFGVYSVKSAVGGGQKSTSSSASSSGLPEQGGATSSQSQSSAVGGVSGNGTNPDSPGITIASKPKGSQMTATEVYKKVIPSVVGVETTIAGQSGQQSGTSEGTGIIATSDGYILTNAHVVNYSRSNPVKVVLHNNRAYVAKVVGYDKTSDLAVLKINATGLSPAEFGSVDDMQVGDSVIAIGNPGGLSFAGSLTGGYISALNRTIEDASDNGMTYIQTDAAINPGNSGGPLVNLYGQVIGINSNKIVATGYEGMGFAIPVSHAKSIIDDLISHGYVAGRTRLGITASTVDPMYQQLYGLPNGVLIASVASDSSLRGKASKGDVITKAGGSKISSMDDLYSMLAKHKPGDVVEMTIVSTSFSQEAGGRKAGTTRTVQVKLLEDKGQTQKTP